MGEPPLGPLGPRETHEFRTARSNAVGREVLLGWHSPGRPGLVRFSRRARPDTWKGPRSAFGKVPPSPRGHMLPRAVSPGTARAWGPTIRTRRSGFSEGNER